MKRFYLMLSAFALAALLPQLAAATPTAETALFSASPSSSLTLPGDEAPVAMAKDKCKKCKCHHCRYKKGKYKCEGCKCKKCKKWVGKHCGKCKCKTCHYKGGGKHKCKKCKCKKC
jgi:hypothetical protein